MIGKDLSSAHVLLAAGALLGAGLASWQIVQRGPGADGPFPQNAVALVDGSPIWRADYERALSGVATATGSAPDGETRRRVLQRLIDEELLVQRGLELGLAARDRRVRADLSAAVIGLLVATAEDGEEAEPDEEELRRFHADNARWFRSSPQLALDALFFRASSENAGAGLERATQARERLVAGETFDDVRSTSDAPDVELPGGPLTPRALGELVGSTATRAALALGPGQVSEPVRTASGYFVVRVRERLEGASPPFDEARDAVAAEHRRRTGERGLESFLEERRREARILFAPEAP